MYTSSQLLYAKNVKRDQGNDWAYLNIQAGDPFELNFPNNPKWNPTNYLRPQIGELIMIFQTINEGHGEDGGTYLTHLVTPIENVLGFDRNSTHPTTRLVLCLAKAEPIIRKSDAWNFKYPNRGQICDFDTIKRMKGKDWGIKRKQKYFFDLFNISQTVSEENVIGIVGESIDLEDELTGLEGSARYKLKKHKYLERNHQLVRDFKRKAFKAGKLYCEVCNFNFAAKYPIIGEKFIECHHKLFLATGGERITSEKELALVCSNCHRMLHKRRTDKTYYSIDALKELINNN